MEDSALGLYSTDLGGLLKFIKYSNDKEKLNDIVNSDPLFQNLNQDAFSLLQAVTKLPIEPPATEGGTVNMCKGLEDWLNDEVNKVRDEDKDKLHKSYLACAQVMVKNHDPANDILDTTDLSMEELKEIAREEGVLLNSDA